MASADSGIETGNESNDGFSTSIVGDSLYQLGAGIVTTARVETGKISNSSSCNSRTCPTFDSVHHHKSTFSAVAIPTGFPMLFESISTLSSATLNSSEMIELSTISELTSTQFSKTYDISEQFKDFKFQSKCRRKNKQRLHYKKELQSFSELESKHCRMCKQERRGFFYEKECQTDVNSVFRKDFVREERFTSKFKLAVHCNNTELVKSCLHKGANPNGVDRLGRSPLHVASSSGYSDIVRILLQNGANPNLRDNHGNTPLHLASCTSHIDVVTLLLKAGTDVCITNQDGHSPLQLAQSKLKFVMDQSKSVRSTLEIPERDYSYVASQTLQIVEIIRLFLQERGNETEAELLGAFSSCFIK